MRLFITTLSMFSVIAFGYALAGYGGGLFGGAYRGDYVLWGLVGGFVFAGIAMYLWHKHRADFFDPIPDQDHVNATDAEGKPVDLSEMPLDAPDWGTKLDMNSVTRYDPPAPEGETLSGNNKDNGENEGKRS